MDQAALKECCLAARYPKICLMVKRTKVNRRVELHVDVLKINVRIGLKLMLPSDKTTQVRCGGIWKLQNGFERWHIILLL